MSLNVAERKLMRVTWHLWTIFKYALAYQNRCNRLKY